MLKTIETHSSVIDSLNTHQPIRCCGARPITWSSPGSKLAKQATWATPQWQQHTMHRLISGDEPPHVDVDSRGWRYSVLAAYDISTYRPVPNSSVSSSLVTTEAVDNRWLCLRDYELHGITKFRNTQSVPQNALNAVRPCDMFVCLFVFISGSWFATMHPLQQSFPVISYVCYPSGFQCPILSTAQCLQLSFFRSFRRLVPDVIMPVITSASPLSRLDLMFCFVSLSLLSQKAAQCQW